MKCVLFPVTIGQSLQYFHMGNELEGKAVL